jgi:hypothetical protein
MGDKLSDEFNKLNSGRGGEIRTHDFLLPKQALYQAELRPAKRGTVIMPPFAMDARKENFQVVF